MTRTKKFAWLPKVSYLDRLFWLKSYYEVKLSRDVTLIDPYDSVTMDDEASGAQEPMSDYEISLNELDNHRVKER